MAHDVFISVSSKDKSTGDAICAVLEKHRIRCWIAPRDLAPGAEWAEAIIDAISGVRCMVLVFSGHANDSPQVRREVERAVNKKIPIIPMRIEDVPPSKTLEYFISTPHWLDAFTPPVEQHLNKLVEAVQRFLDHGEVPVSPQNAETRLAEAVPGTKAGKSTGPTVPGRSGKAIVMAVSAAALFATLYLAAPGDSRKPIEPSTDLATLVEPPTKISPLEANQRGNSARERKDYIEAMRWYRQAADQGDAAAQDNIGSLYENRQGVAQDYAEAMRWYRKAADQGLAEAQYDIGTLYQNGQGVAPDYTDAMRWYRKAADQGYAAAQNNIGSFYAEGRGVPKDCSAARPWFEKAAAGGDEIAKTWLQPNAACSWAK